MTLLTLLIATSPIVIGHRGASGYLPEHTLEAYELAVRQGADYIEPDLVITKDGVLIARHENEIGETTDIGSRPEFAALRTTKQIDGRQVEGWFAEDLTYAQIQSLRARERLPKIRTENVKHDGKYRVPSFDDVLRLAARLRKETGREIGVYPETKHPTFFQGLSLPLEPPLLKDLETRGFTSGVYIQSFEQNNLKWLASRTKLPLVQLVMAVGRPFSGDMTYAEMLSDPAKVATYAQGLGIQKDALWPEEQGREIVRKAKAAGLKVHVWTHRKEPQFVMAPFKGDARQELAYLFSLGIDGVFTDFPDLGVQGRNAFREKTR